MKAEAETIPAIAGAVTEAGVETEGEAEVEVLPFVAIPLRGRQATRCTHFYFSSTKIFVLVINLCSWIEV